MIKELFERLTSGENQREALSKLREQIKDEMSYAELKAIAGEGEAMIALLSHEDAKTRKNAALLLIILVATLKAGITMVLLPALRENGMYFTTAPHRIARAAAVFALSLLSLMKMGISRKWSRLLKEYQNPLTQEKK